MPNPLYSSFSHSDVLPWQSYHRYGDSCENALFIDIDYPDLMRKKRGIVLGTPELRELLGDDPFISEKDTDHLLLRSDKYCQIGCDLRELESLRKCLESFLTLSECSVLFVAEVSITYMDTASADALIQWASSIGQGTAALKLAKSCSKANWPQLNFVFWNKSSHMGRNTPLPARC
jgi:tRNA wybutosine-synthesizing protein 4